MVVKNLVENNGNLKSRLSREEVANKSKRLFERLEERFSLNNNDDSLNFSDVYRVDINSSNGVLHSSLYVVNFGDGKISIIPSYLPIGSSLNIERFSPNSNCDFLNYVMDSLKTDRDDFSSRSIGVGDSSYSSGIVKEGTSS